MTIAAVVISVPAGSVPTRVRDDGDMTAGEFTNAHPALSGFWHPVALSSEVGSEPVAVRLAGLGWALARIGGNLAAFADACPHRRARLSAGQVTDGTLQCMYHGWRFAADGRCVAIPALEDGAAIPERATLRRSAATPSPRCSSRSSGWRRTPRC